MKLKHLKFIRIIVPLVFVFGGCITPSDKIPSVPDSPAVPNDFFINAALYNYYTAEYKALAYQAFNSASDYLELLKLKKTRDTKMAIVLDIDETLLDNSPYQARLYEINSSYDTLWNVWCNMAIAKPVPGAVEFLNFADSLGYNIFYVSNRKHKPVYRSTLKNLLDAGFPQADSSHIHLRTDSNSKQARRELIEKNYDIVMLVGDNIADFYEDTDNYAARDSIVEANKAHFGRRFVALPNAIYGNWLNSLQIEKKSDVDSLISIMTLPFEQLTP